MVSEFMEETWESRPFEVSSAREIDGGHESTKVKMFAEGS